MPDYKIVGMTIKNENLAIIDKYRESQKRSVIINKILNYFLTQEESMIKDFIQH